mgnify:CR=1 FL=1
MFRTFVNAWKIVDLRKKLLFTALIILIYRIGSALPVPFVDIAMRGDGLFGEEAAGTFLTYLSMMTGNAFNYGTLFALSITPYINASIIIQLLAVAIPYLQNLSKEGEEGRKKMNKITRYGAIGLGLLQSIAYYFFIRSQDMLMSDANGKAFTGFAAVFQAVVVILCYTAGTALVMWLGEQINEKGIGNGVSMIIFAGIVKRVPEMASSLYASATKINDMLVTKSAILGVVAAIGATLLVLAFAIAIIIFVIYVQGAERRIPVQYSKKTVGRKLYGGQSSYLPLKVNQSGVMPVIFATSMLTFFNLIGTALFKPDTLLGKWSANFGTSPFYYVVFFLLIIGFTFFYSIIQFHPIEISNNLKTNGGFIPGIRPGRPTSEYIYNTVKRLNLADALFLSIVVLVPTIIGTLTGMQNVWFAGTSVLILTGVCSDLITQIETQLVARNQSGFLD